MGRPFHQKLMTELWTNHKGEQKPNLNKTVFTYIYSFKRKTKKIGRCISSWHRNIFSILFAIWHSFLWLRLHSKEEIWADYMRGFFYSGLWGQIPFAWCASQIPEKTFLPLLQMWFVLVLSVLGYEVKVEKLGKKLRISSRLQIHKRFNEAKVWKMNNIYRHWVLKSMVDILILFNLSGFKKCVT